MARWTSQQLDQAKKKIEKKASRKESGGSKVPTSTENYQKPTIIEMKWQEDGIWSKDTKIIPPGNQELIDYYLSIGGEYVS